MISAIFFTAIFIASPCMQDEGFTLIMENGDELTVDINSIEANSISVSMEDSGEIRSINAGSVNRLRFPGEAVLPSSEIRIRLVDGSIIAGTRLQTRNQTAVFSESEKASTRQKISTRNIKSIEFGDQIAALREQWSDISDPSQLTGDRLVFQRENHLDYVEGAVGDVTEDSIQFTSGDRTAEADRDRISGIVFFHAIGREMAAPIARLTTVSGSQLLIRAMRRSEPMAGQVGEELIAQTVCGAELHLRSSEIVDIDFASLRQRFLSDLEPATVEWRPLIFNSAIYEYRLALSRPRINRSFHDQPLELDFGVQSDPNEPTERMQFNHGLACKGGTRMVFALDGEYSKLNGFYGFAPDAPQDGQVEVVISGDGNDLLRTVLNNKSDGSRKLELEVLGVERLTLQVNYQDGRNIGDVIHFCELKMSKQ